MSVRNIPKALYKYRAFNVNTLRMLSEAEIYYADPTRFNDPLDSNPALQIDVDVPQLEDLLHRMIFQRYGQHRADQEVNMHRLCASRYGNISGNAKARTSYLNELGENVLHCLRREIGSKGVLSLAEKWNCPLMWSHYADEHRGVCIEYDLTDHAFDNLEPVNYRAGRSIRASQLIDWKVKRSKSAEGDIMNTYFLAKAPSWRYEKEWREIDDQTGTKSSSANVSAVYFGLRCDPAIISAIVKIHVRTERSVKFYSVRVNEDSFQLKRRIVDSKDILAIGFKTSAKLEFRDGVESAR